MNKVILSGRLTREPEVRYSTGENGVMIARYTMAVDRKHDRERQSADFINCVAFGRAAEFAKKYFRQGIKINISGHIQTGSYTNRDGVRVYTTDVIIEEQKFAESKAASAGYTGPGNGREAAGGYPADNDGFINIPDGIDNDLPFC